MARAPAGGRSPSRTTNVLRVANGRVTFRMEYGKTHEPGKGDPQLRCLNHACASTVHAVQGRTVDNVTVAMEARFPQLTMQKRFCIEITRARNRSELVNDAKAELQAATGKRIAAFESTGEMKRKAPDKGVRIAENATRQPDREPGRERGTEGGNDIARPRARGERAEPRHGTVAALISVA